MDGVQHNLLQHLEDDSLAPAILAGILAGGRWNFGLTRSVGLIRLELAKVLFSELAQDCKELSRTRVVIKNPIWWNFMMFHCPVKY